MLKAFFNTVYFQKTRRFRYGVLLKKFRHYALFNYPEKYEQGGIHYGLHNRTKDY